MARNNDNRRNGDRVVELVTAAAAAAAAVAVAVLATVVLGAALTVVGMGCANARFGAVASRSSYWSRTLWLSTAPGLLPQRGDARGVHRHSRRLFVRGRSTDFVGFEFTQANEDAYHMHVAMRGAAAAAQIRAEEEERENEEGGRGEWKPAATRGVDSATGVGTGAAAELVAAETAAAREVRVAAAVRAAVSVASSPAMPYTRRDMSDEEVMLPECLSLFRSDRAEKTLSYSQRSMLPHAKRKRAGDRPPLHLRRPSLPAPLKERVEDESMDSACAAMGPVVELVTAAAAAAAVAVAVLIERMIAKHALDGLQQLDPLNLFMDTVTGVPGYTEVIKSPIDFSTIRRRSQRGL
eukprot:g18514.t1